MLKNSRSNQINLDGSNESDDVKDKKMIDFDADPMSNFPPEGFDDLDDSEAF
jgi:hypothetical protein